jgi:hypothetical protein
MRSECNTGIGIKKRWTLHEPCPGGSIVLGFQAWLVIDLVGTPRKMRQVEGEGEGALPRMTWFTGIWANWRRAVQISPLFD